MSKTESHSQTPLPWIPAATTRPQLLRPLRQYVIVTLLCKELATGFVQRRLCNQESR